MIPINTLVCVCVCVFLYTIKHCFNEDRPLNGVHQVFIEHLCVPGTVLDVEGTRAGQVRRPPSELMYFTMEKGSCKCHVK